MPKIDCVYIAACAKDYHWTKCCVSSIRQWYEDIPIYLIKDDSLGEFDSCELEKYWRVGILPTERKSLGFGFGKLEPFFLPKGQRCLILDSDILFAGRVIDSLERLDGDLILCWHNHSAESGTLLEYYFDLERLRQLDPDFVFPGFAFNTGQLVTDTGVLVREDFEKFLADSAPVTVKHPDVFRCGEQGLLNYVLMKKQQQGHLSLTNGNFMRWTPGLEDGMVRIEELGDGSKYPFVLHWAGPKLNELSLNAYADWLKYFEDRYYERIPAGRKDHDAPAPISAPDPVKGPPINSPQLIKAPNLSWSIRPLVKLLSDKLHGAQTNDESD